MITILRETPIDFDGVDYLEQLVHDSECAAGEACYLCCYTGYESEIERYADCCTVHGCTLSDKTYFKITRL